MRYVPSTAPHFTALFVPTWAVMVERVRDGSKYGVYVPNVGTVKFCLPEKKTSYITEGRSPDTRSYLNLLFEGGDIILDFPVEDFYYGNFMSNMIKHTERIWELSSVERIPVTVLNLVESGQELQ